MVMVYNLGKCVSLVSRLFWLVKWRKILDVSNGLFALVQPHTMARRMLADNVVSLVKQRDGKCQPLTVVPS